MQKIVFTNGCFDIIHRGHIDLLQQARALGTRLIVGINSDRSVRAIKGDARPFLDAESRAAILRELRSVDEVRVFDENTPESLIKTIKPDVLVKGGDWSPEQIIGADFVLESGGRVFSIPFRRDVSSSRIVEKIRASGNEKPAAAFNRIPEECSAEDSVKTPVEPFDYLLRHEAANISAAAEIIGASLADGKKIIICGANENDALMQCAARILSGENVKFRERIIYQPAGLFLRGGGSLRGDVLVAAPAGENSSDIISAVLKARRGAARTIAVTPADEKKIAALSDVRISLRDAGANARVENFLLIAILWRRIIETKALREG